MIFKSLLKKLLTELFVLFSEKIILLDKLFFKILASESDYDFQQKLHEYLPKLLDKLATNEEIVRKKVI